IILASLFLLTILLNVGLSIFLKSKINSFSNDDFNIELDDLSLNLLAQTVNLSEININSKNHEKDSIILTVSSVVINGISLIDVLKPQNIQLSDLIIKKP